MSWFEGSKACLNVGESQRDNGIIIEYEFQHDPTWDVKNPTRTWNVFIELPYMMHDQVLIISKHV